MHIVQNGSRAMVRWLAENNITNAVEIQAFDQLGYHFQPDLFENEHHIFLKDKT